VLNIARSTVSDIRAKTRVVIDVYAISRDPNSSDNSNESMPARFMLCLEGKIVSWCIACYDGNRGFGVLF